jgi:glycosyltransferase involved in cell wall biosynthesis
VPELVSVIIPIFNAAAYLPQAVASVRAQDHSPLEIIVVDDGSTDTTADVAQSLPDVRYFHQPNAGPAAARNRGIREARGEILAFLDADDLWATGKLAAQLPVLRQFPDEHLVAGHVEQFTSDDVAPTANRDTVVPRDHGRRAYTVGALLVRREDFHKVGGFDPALRFGEFMDWLSRAKTRGLREQVLDQVVLYRRLHATNTTRLARDHQRHYLTAIRRHLERQRAPSPGPGGTNA